MALGMAGGIESVAAAGENRHDGVTWWRVGDGEISSAATASARHRRGVSSLAVHLYAGKSALTPHLTTCWRTSWYGASSYGYSIFSSARRPRLFRT